MTHHVDSSSPSEYLADNPQFPTKLIVFTLFIGAFFGYLNDTLLNVALPTLMNEFQVSKTTVQWLVTGFLLLMGALTPITASLIQWFPPRRLILITQGLFVVGSLICATAPNFAFLLLGRMVQAVSAALFVPLLMNGILTIYPPHKRGTAMGLVTMMFTVAPALGPTLSGMIIDELNWRYLFGLTIPFMLVAMILTTKFLNVNLSEITRPKIDLLSSILSVLGFGGLIYGSSQFSALSGSLFTLIMLISLIFVIWFAKRQFQLETPLLNLRVFAVHQFRLSVLILLCAYFLFMGMEVMMPMYTQQVLLISATTTGLILMPASIAQAIAAPVLGVLLDKKGGRWVLLPATFVLLISLILMWLLFDIQTSTLALSALFALMAMAVSAAITGETHGLNALDKPLHPHGTAVITTLNPIAAALGASIFVGVMNIGEHIGTFATPQAATLNGVHWSMTGAVAVATLACYFGLFIRRNVHELHG